MAVPMPAPRAPVVIANSQDSDISSSGRQPDPVGYADPRVASTSTVQPLGALDPVAAQQLPANQYGINDNPGAINGPAQPVAASQFNVGGRTQ